MSRRATFPSPPSLGRSAVTERADVLAAIDSRIRACRSKSVEHHHFQALRDEIAAGMHERNEG